jgi:hypothetical protein
VATCASRDCCWAPSDAEGVPWCFHATQPAPAPAACAASPLALRLDCWDAARDGGHASPEACAARGCCWTPVGAEGAGANVPWCHHPGGYGEYVVSASAGGRGAGTAAAASTTQTQTLRLASFDASRGPTRHEPRSLTATVDAVGAAGVRLRVAAADDDAAPPRRRAWALADTPLGVPRAVPPAARRGVAAALAAVGEPFRLELQRLPPAADDAADEAGEAPPPRGPVVLSTIGALSAAPALAEVSFALPASATLHGLGEHVAPWALGGNSSAPAGHVYTIWCVRRGPACGERVVGRAKRAPEVSVRWGERSEPPKRAQRAYRRWRGEFNYFRLAALAYRMWRRETNGRRNIHRLPLGSTRLSDVARGNYRLAAWIRSRFRGGDKKTTLGDAKDL